MTLYPPQVKNIEYQIESLVDKTRRYLLTTLGRTLEEATDQEFYHAFSLALRETIMINWQAAAHTFLKNDVRMLYYISLEHLPGKILSQTITGLQKEELLQKVMMRMKRAYNTILECERDPGLGNGGLGRLASCFLESLATLQYPAQAYGLRYHYGIFEQQLWDGEQVEIPDCWLISENPWQFRRDLRRVSVKFGGHAKAKANVYEEPSYDLENFDEVWVLPYDVPIVGFQTKNPFSVLTLRLWSTKESPRNFHLQRFNAGRLDEAAENTTLTDVLYPSDHHETGKRIRLKQEFLLVSASLQDIIRHYLFTHDNFKAFPDKVRIQINDTHPSLVIPELIRLLTHKYDISWQKACEIAESCTSYTNHTILQEALEEWDTKLMQTQLPRQYEIIERLNANFCTSIRKTYPNDEAKVRRLSIIQDGKVRMAKLAILGSHTINGVAQLHTKILKEDLFREFYDLFPDKFSSITNGITQRRFLLQCNPLLSSWITKRIGDGWITDLSQISKLNAFTHDAADLETFLAIKRRCKENLIDFIQENCKLRDQKGVIVSPPPVIYPDSLFDVQIKRIHEYKRQLMHILHLIMLYQEMKTNPNHERIPRTAIFAGKAAAQYETAKAIIRLIASVAHKVNHDEDVSGHLRILFIENYSVTKAERIIPAAELSEQISTAGMEASGTGNMKLALNGALTIGTEDGANIEMRRAIGDANWPFRFGCTADELAKASYSPQNIAKEHPNIALALETLKNRTFARNDEEHFLFCDLYNRLTQNFDRYHTLLDLPSYYEAQKKVDALYQDPMKWASCAIHNVACMGMFSSDRAIQHYSKDIWRIQPCPIDKDILDHIQNAYGH